MPDPPHASVIDSQDDELLATGGWPAWVRWLAGILAAIAAVGVVVDVAVRHHSAHKVAHAATKPTTNPVLLTAPFAPLQVPLAGAAVDDVLTTGRLTFVLTGHTLLRTNGSTWSGHATVPDSGGRRRLLLDSDSPILWVVDLSGNGATAVQAFDATTLRELHTYRWPRPVAAAVPVRGSIYVADAAGLHRLTTDGTNTPVAVAWARRIFAFTADPRNDRTLALIGPRRSPRLGVLGELVPFSTIRLPAGLTDPNLGVTEDGDIWLAGRGRSGAVLDQLDPKTLQPQLHSPLARQLGPAAVIQAGGTSSVLVSSATGAAGLWCVNASSGTAARRWRLDASGAAVTQGLALAVTGATVNRLGLGTDCSG